MRRKTQWIYGIVGLALCALTAPVLASPPSIDEAERLTVGALLGQNLTIAEAARELVPEIHNPRLWLADGFLAVFRAEMKALRAGPDWQTLTPGKERRWRESRRRFGESGGECRGGRAGVGRDYEGTGCWECGTRGWASRW